MQAVEQLGAGAENAADAWNAGTLALEIRLVDGKIEGLS